MQISNKRHTHPHLIRLITLLSRTLVHR